MKISSGIYCIKNIKNNKRYIGQSVNIEERFRQHIRDFNKGRNHNKYFANAWNIYGSDSFVFYTILYLPNIKFIMDIFEMFFIFFYKSHIKNNGYNILYGATPKNTNLSEETRRKISENNSRYWSGKKRDLETIEKIRKKTNREKTFKRIRNQKINKPYRKKAIKRRNKQVRWGL